MIEHKGGNGVAADEGDMWIRGGRSGAGRRQRRGRRAWQRSCIAPALFSSAKWTREMLCIDSCVQVDKLAPGYPV
jgi:hypothetical protein